MIFVGIDPGTAESGLVVWSTTSPEFPHSPKAMVAVKWSNENILSHIKDWGGPHGANLVVIEQFKCYGMAVGDETLAAVRWSGRFEQVAIEGGAEVLFLPRKTVVTHLCGSSKAKDGNVRQALIDRLGAPGTKKRPGPTYGISGDMWSALALCVVGMDLKQNSQRLAGERKD